MKVIIPVLLCGLLAGCMEAPQPNATENEKTEKRKDSFASTDISKIEAKLKEEGYQTFRYKEGDTTYLMQQYYLVFLKSGPNRSQDSTEAADLQKKHMAHLSRLYEEGYTSLTGPTGDDGEIRGIVVFNTATQKEADSLARLDPMVKAGRLEVEVHPWWVAKGGKLN
ncbi:YciI family protein [Christiangramia crocea]|uniref:YciI family protein n=1 Tax=Christiangramia crocea TaxID=2904124 RepID=A0A9X1UVC7_9FLAO|nr:YciI family protein [Gramella crocea]MCG9971092.1 YciI family protein [Gramella crocea]